MSAAILIADLRGFTALADRDDPFRVVECLNAHLEALAQPVERCGGEVSKYLGDGFLAIFPSDAFEGDPGLACRAALTAAREGLLRNAGLCDARRRAGSAAMDVRMALHFGDVVHGNVGAGRRLDFTVIGRAVNEASRIERLCGRFGLPLILSDDFARRCGSELELLGHFRLRGVEREKPLWIVPREAGATGYSAIPECDAGIFAMPTLTHDALG